MYLCTNKRKVDSEIFHSRKNLTRDGHEWYRIASEQKPFCYPCLIVHIVKSGNINGFNKLSTRL